MPYRKTKTKSGKIRLTNAETGEVYAKSTTKEKAEAQIRAIEASKHNPNFRKRVKKGVMGK